MFSKGKGLILGALLVLVLSACGQQTNTASDAGTGAATLSNTATASGMDHGNTTGTGASSSAAAGNSSGMDHGVMGTATSNAPYDAQFIDSMIEHHTSAIAMAEDALKNAERQEIKDLAQTIINDQQREVDQMNGWRQQWYPDLAPTGGMGMDMGDMTVGGDANQPYDQRFITAMIDHHTSAIEMAKDALNKAEHPEIKQLAEQIITAQEAEIAQMQQWQKEWFGA